MAGTSSPAGQRALWGWGTRFDTEEERAFLAQRVALYARQIAVFFALLYVVGLAVVAVLLPGQLIAIHLHPAKLANALVIVLALGVWWAVRQRDCSPVALIAGDAVLPLLVNLGVALAAPYVPPTLALTFMPLLISVLALMFRAALLPASASGAHCRPRSMACCCAAWPNAEKTVPRERARAPGCVARVRAGGAVE